VNTRPLKQRIAKTVDKIPSIRCFQAKLTARSENLTRRPDLMEPRIALRQLVEATRDAAGLDDPDAGFGMP
jgi:hypothetical protein